MTDVRVNWLKVVDSTNSEAQRCRHDSPDFTVWAAEFQTAGRGQRGNTWESAVGENLTFSILFKPAKFLSTRQFELSEVVALGVVNYLSTKGIKAKIKWPNDIYVEDKKICGILIENTLSSDTLSVCIAGIGLNLNQRIFRSDAPNPTSVVLELERIAGNRAVETAGCIECNLAGTFSGSTAGNIVCDKTGDRGGNTGGDTGGNTGGNTTPLKSTVSQASVHEIALSSGETPRDACKNTTFTSVTKHPLNDREELLLLLQEIAKLYFPLTQPDTSPGVMPHSVLASHHDTIQTPNPTLEEQYLSVLYRRDELHTYVDLTTGETFRGYIRGVEKNACLRIEKETGETKAFAFKELKYII